MHIETSKDTLKTFLLALVISLLFALYQQNETYRFKIAALTRETQTIHETNKALLSNFSNMTCPQASGDFKIIYVIRK